MRGRAWAVAAAWAAGLAVASGAGPGADPAGPSPAAGEGRPEADTRLLRARLERSRDMFDAAIQRLDAGAPPREVAREVWRSLREENAWWGPGGEGPRGDGAGAATQPALSADELRALILSRLPSLGDRIEELRRTDPGRAGVFLERFGRRVHEVESETADDPELRDLKLAELDAGVRVFETMRDVRAGVEGGDLTEEQAVVRLAEALGHQFDARLAVARLELDRLREKLARTEREVEAMGDRRGDEVRRMTERIMAHRPGGADGPAEGRRRGPGLRSDRP